MTGVSTLSDLAGIEIIFRGIWLLIQGFKAWEKSVAAAVADIIIAVLAILWGVVFIGNVKEFTFFNLPCTLHRWILHNNKWINRSLL